MYHPQNPYGEDFRHFHGGPPEPPFGPPPPSSTGQMPMGAPPGFAPPMPTWQQGTRSIRSCLFRNTYIWMNNGRSFWFYPTAVGQEFIAGFRWSNRHGWRFRTITRNQIRSFECFR
ncbi:hypothetical protein [Lysinibacillus piscis]|uniref:Transporter n=1 Tax=Lysinibacillus piscis TaxID=2518931 RepID=A0ABQ5NMG9_9BACI|nr:hypothetical protein [Lysinibacillus sp. KH24]GLC89529.1 hypothetical protein LYSBPC_26560 [Lysinibacillus sp. KH24]